MRKAATKCDAQLRRCVFGRASQSTWPRNIAVETQRRATAVSTKYGKSHGAFVNTGVCAGSAARGANDAAMVVWGDAPASLAGVCDLSPVAITTPTG